MDDQVAMGDDLYVVKHLIVSNEIVGGESLACVVVKLYIVADVDLVLDLHVGVVDVDFDALMQCGHKLHVDWLVVIQMIMLYGWMLQVWVICEFVLLFVWIGKP